MMSLYWVVLLSLLGIFCQECLAQKKDRNRGAFVEMFRNTQHNVNGAVWAIDEDLVFVENFTYDGKGPDAFFWVGKEGRQPSPNGHIIRFPFDSSETQNHVLRRFDRENVILRLPSGIKVTEVKWLSVWCRRFTMDFGHVLFPKGLEPPRKVQLPEFKRLAHGVRSGNITILDAKTFYIPDLHYDGAGPDAYFWVGEGTKPDNLGKKVPNERGSYDVLGGYEGVDIEIQLPDNLTVYDIDYLAIWCVTYKHNFGHVLIPHDNLWVPPALGQTRVKPPWWYMSGAHQGSGSMMTPEFPNCRSLSDDLQVEWQSEEKEVRIRLTARMSDDQYMAFGISPEVGKSEMLNSDVVVAYYDKEDKSFHAVDYTLSREAQCDGSYGVCPDERVNGRNDASVISGDRRNGITTITYTRPHNTDDPSDLPILPSEGEVNVVAAVGELNLRKEANFHSKFVVQGDIRIDFSARGDNTCDPPAGFPEVAEELRYEPWPVTVIRSATNFSACIGPVGGDRGYKAITGKQGCEIAWWINGALIPELYVERGQTYYFTVEGGDDTANTLKYHPLYITNSPTGGFGQKTKDERSQEIVYAGVEYSKMGQPNPTAVGRLCEWKHKGTDAWEDSVTLSEYRDKLYRVCETGLEGSLTWFVEQDTPDIVYYQCYTHENMGWKIHVVDRGYKLRREGDNGAPPLLLSPSPVLRFLLVASSLLLHTVALR